MKILHQLLCLSLLGDSCGSHRSVGSSDAFRIHVLVITTSFWVIDVLATQNKSQLKCIKRLFTIFSPYLSLFVIFYYARCLPILPDECLFQLKLFWTGPPVICSIAHLLIDWLGPEIRSNNFHHWFLTLGLTDFLPPMVWHYEWSLLESRVARFSTSSNFYHWDGCHSSDLPTVKNITKSNYIPNYSTGYILL